MKKTGSPVATKIISETVRNKNSYTRFYIQPWKNEKEIKKICKVLNLSEEELKEKNLKLTLEILG
jgi:hypothetical protein